MGEKNETKTIQSRVKRHCVKRTRARTASFKYARSPQDE